MATDPLTALKRRLNFKAIGAVFAAFAATLGFLLTNRRTLAILYDLAIHELIAYGPILAVIAVLGTAAFASWRSPVAGPRLRIAAAASRQWIFPAALLLVIVSAATLWVVERWRYRVYSEVEHQNAVMSALKNGRVVAARTQCEAYFAKYPQRREESTIPDPVCTQVLSLSRDLGTLRHYIANQPPRREVVKIRGIGVPFGWGTRSQAIEVLKQLSGDSPPPKS